MDFCDFCNNMYYIKETDTKELIYYCKNCGCEKEIKESQTSKKIISNDYDSINSKYIQYVNKNIMYDNTIPHVNNVMCTNEQCTKKDDQDNDIMYIKYDINNINYLYFCTYCNHFWTNK